LSSLKSDMAREGDEDRILEINRLEYGPGDILATGEDFAWRQRQNPAGQAIIPVIRDHEGHVAGFIWVVPMRVRVGGQDFASAMGSNLVIHPDSRNSLGYAMLIRNFQRIFDERRLPFHFSFVSRETFLRERGANPRMAATVPALIKVYDWPKTLRAYAKGRRMEPGSGAFKGRKPSLLSSKREEIVDQAILIRQKQGFDERFDRFWEGVRDKYSAFLIRDKSFLGWRFAPVSGRKYEVLVAETAGLMLGYAVLGCAIIRGVAVGLISDFLVSGDSLGREAGVSLLKEAGSLFRECGMEASAALAPRFSDEYRILRRAGFLPLPRFFSLRTSYFAVFLHPGSANAPASLSAKNWFMTFADYESL